MNKLLPGSRPDLLNQARKLGITGTSDMKVADLREAVGEAVKKVAAPRGGAAAKAHREAAAAEAPDAAAEPTEAAPEPNEAPQDFDSQLAELQAMLAQSGKGSAAGPPVPQGPPPVEFPSVPRNRLLEIAAKPVPKPAAKKGK